MAEFTKVNFSRQVHGSNFDFWASVWICFVRLLAALIAAKYIKNFGRRTIYLTTASLTVFLHAIFGLVVYLQIGLTYKWIPLVVISILTFFIQIGPESFPNLISSELFPNDARSNGKGVLRAISSVFSFLVLTSFPVVKEAIGLDMTFLALSLTLLLTLVPTFLYLPEAKDIDLNYVSQFYSPIQTNFYNHPPSASSGLPPSQAERRNRIKMIENTFGFSPSLKLMEKDRKLVGEGMLGVRETGDKGSKQRHVFLFSDTILVATIITPNIVNSGLKLFKLDDVIQLKSIGDSNCWKMGLSGKI